VRDCGRQNLHFLPKLAGLFESERVRDVLQYQNAALFVIEEELANGGLHDERIVV